MWAVSSARKTCPTICSRATSQLRYPDANPPAEIEMCLLSLEAWSLLFIDAARAPAQIDTISLRWAFTTRSLQIEVRIRRRLWHFSRYELPERLWSFVTSSFKVHLQVDLWWSTRTLWVTGGRVMRKCTKMCMNWLERNGLCDYLSAPRTAYFSCHFQSFRFTSEGPFYGCMLFLLFLIKRKYWCLPDLLIVATEKFMGYVSFSEVASELSPT